MKYETLGRGLQEVSGEDLVMAVSHRIVPATDGKEVNGFERIGDLNPDLILGLGAAIARLRDIGENQETIDKVLFGMKLMAGSLVDLVDNSRLEQVWNDSDPALQ